MTYWCYFDCLFLSTLNKLFKTRARKVQYSVDRLKIQQFSLYVKLPNKLQNAAPDETVWISVVSLVVNISSSEEDRQSGDLIKKLLHNIRIHIYT